jgi:hypothetical protein
MKLGLAEIFEKASKMQTDDERIMVLRQNFSAPLESMIRGAFDPNIVWLLPEGSPPYKPNTLVDQEGSLYNQTRKLYLFVQNGHQTLKQLRREALFVELLETVSEADAKLLLAVKDKTLPYPNITRELINKGFPGLLPA